MQNDDRETASAVGCLMAPLYLLAAVGLWKFANRADREAADRDFKDALALSTADCSAAAWNEATQVPCNRCVPMFGGREVNPHPDMSHNEWLARSG